VDDKSFLFARVAVPEAIPLYTQVSSRYREVMCNAIRETPQVPLLQRYQYGQKRGKEDQDHGTAKAAILQELQTQVYADEPTGSPG
jgi:hypothetical protein